MAGSLVVAWAREVDSTGSFILFSSVFMILYNLLPLSWVMKLQPTGPVPRNERLNDVGLTGREREVLHLLSMGCTNQEIADRLFISLATVKDHNTNIFRKAGVRNRVELVNWSRGEVDVSSDPGSC